MAIMDEEMKRLASLTAIATTIFAPIQAFAQTIPGEDINLKKLQGDRGIDISTKIQTLLTQVITFVFIAAALAVLVMLIWGAWSWITSGGDKAKIEGAQKRITSALIGLAVLALAFLVARIVGSIVGFDILTNFQVPTLGIKAGSCPPGGNDNCIPLR